MIPKVIHYCWFGNNNKSRLVKKCIKSWKKYCPEYKIIEWNETNFNLECNDYVIEAYKHKKWAFVSDYVRLWVIYNYGGIYLDTDVELIKSLNTLLKNKAYFGSEDGIYIATGLGFGAEKGNSVVACMLKDYDNIHFEKANGDLDLTPCPKRNTVSIQELLKKKKVINNITYIENATIYPKDFFCPLNYEDRSFAKTKNTYSIHWYNASWVTKSQYLNRRKNIMKYKIDRLVHLPNRFLMVVLGKEKYECLKNGIKRMKLYVRKK